MKIPKLKFLKYPLYEYIIYWLITAVVLLLAVPVLIIQFITYLVRSTGAPLKSVKNLIGFILVLLIISAGYLFVEIAATYDLGSSHRMVTVNENEHFGQIISDLHKVGVIRSEYLFRAAAIIWKVDKYVIPGRYDFKGKVSVYTVLQKFRNRDVATVMVTIPEGSNVYKIAGILSHDLGIDSTAFVAKTLDTAFTRQKFGLNGLEGYLFPETYQLWYGMKIDGIVEEMVAEFRRRVTPVVDSMPPDIHNLQELLTLASIIQGEATQPDEMPLVSSVYHNRLRENMLLQADPTVLYAMGGAPRLLNSEDLKIQSPYNTYVKAGLPPGPINSPGISAIEAALKPAASGYYYFVADGSGRHIFSRTLDEHNTARLRVKIMQKYSKPG